MSPTARAPGARRWGGRVAWFVAIYAASIGGLGLVAWGLRAWLHG